MSQSSFFSDFSGTAGSPPTARQLYQAFKLLLYEFAYDGEVESALSRLEAFTQRWGRLSTDTLVTVARRFAPGQPRSEVDGEERDDVAYYGPGTSEEADTYLALAALAVMRTAETPSVLLPYLTSPYAIERWLAALGLVMMRDERVLPAIERMLTEFVGPMQPWTPQGGSPQNFVLWRHQLLRLLADWGDSRVVPSIRAGLIANVRAEEIEVPEPQPSPEFVWNGRYYTGQEVQDRFFGFYNEQLSWVDGEHQFVYALGRLGAFGALEGVPTRRGVYSMQNALTSVDGGEDYFEPCLPESHADEFRANIWRVLMCFGALESRFRGLLGTTYNFSYAPGLAAAVEQLLAGMFGMDEATRHRAMEDFDRASWTYWTVILYAWDTERARERELLVEGGSDEDEEDDKIDEQARDE